MLNIYERLIRVVDYKDLGKVFRYNSRNKTHIAASKLLHLETLIYDEETVIDDRKIDDIVIKNKIVPEAIMVSELIGLELDMDDNRIRYADYEMDLIPKSDLNDVINHRKSSVHTEDFRDTNKASNYSYNVSFYSPYKLFTTLDLVSKYISKDVDFLLRNNISDNFILVVIDLPTFLMERVTTQLDTDIVVVTSRKEKFLPLWVCKILENDDMDNNYIRELVWLIKKSIPIPDYQYSYNIIKEIFFNYFMREWKPKSLDSNFEEIFKIKFEDIVNVQWERGIITINKDKIPILTHNVDDHTKIDIDTIFNVLNDKLDKYR